MLQLWEPLTAKTSGGDQRSGSGRYPIDQGIGCGADSQPRQHIQNGVLLEEYGRQADEHGHGQKAQPPALGAEAPDVPGSEVHRKGANDVNRRADVGVGVCGVQLCGEPRQQVAAQQCGPQMLAVAACIVLAEDAALDETAKKKAAQQDITVLATELPVFDAALWIWQQMQGGEQEL